MKRKIIVFISIMLFAVLAYSSDNKREGFLFSGGLGLGFNHSNQSLNDYDNSFTKPAFMLDIKIGGTLKGGYHSIYFNNKETFLFNVETLSGDNETLVNNLFSFAYSYHFEGDNPRGFYVSGGGGLTLFNSVDDMGNIALGPGIFAETGYDFCQHFSVAFLILYTSTEKDSLNTRSFISGIIVNGNLY